MTASSSSPIAAWRPPRTAVLLLWALVAGFALLRLLWLDADPPGYILDEFITDEGWYSHVARNHALFGQWVMDEHNVPLVLCPLHTLSVRLSYAFFGVSFWSTRLVGAVASVLTVLAVGWRLRRLPLSAALASLLVATNPILFSLGRVAYCESLQLLFVTAVWILASDDKRRPRSWLMAGAAGGLAFLAKASAAYAPVLALSAPLLAANAGDRRRTVREMGWVTVGLGLVALAYLPFGLRFLDQLRIEQSREGSVLWSGSRLPLGLFLPLMLGLHWTAVVHPGFWVGLFPVLAVGGVATARLTASLPHPQHLRAPVRLAVAWMVCSVGFLCLRSVPAMQERYWANLLVPLACLVALACDPGLKPSARMGRAGTWVVAALLATGPVLLVRHGTLALVGIVFSEPGRALVRLRFMVPVVLAASAIVTILLRRGHWTERSTGGRALLALAMAAIAVGGLAVAVSLSSPSYSIRDTSRALREGGGLKVLTGDLANTLALETPFYAFVYRDLLAQGLGPGWINGDWRARGATHWVSDAPPGGVSPGRRTPSPAGAKLQSVYPAWPDATGHPRITVCVSLLPSEAPGGRLH